MQDFYALYAALDASTATRDKVAALASYLQTTPASEAVHAVALLGGRRPRRVLNSRELRQLATHLSGLPEWLVEETYAHVGDLAETVALLAEHAATSESATVGTQAADQAPARALPGGQQAQAGAAEGPLSLWLGQRLPALAELPAEARIERLCDWLRPLSRMQRFVLLKLITGAFRVGVSQGLLAKALAQAHGLPLDLLADRLAGSTLQQPADYQALVAAAGAREEGGSRPYPFQLASPLRDEPSSLGAPQDWLVEWKWDGIRAQLIRRKDVLVWSRGEERLDGRFPELEAAAATLPPGCVLDGEILAWNDGHPLPFAQLQRRIGRRRPGPRLLAEVPLRFLAYDLLEQDFADIRPLPLHERRSRLLALLGAHAQPALDCSPALPVAEWSTLTDLRAQARQRGVEGLMLKRLDSAYRQGRRRGDWWKWKLDPLSIDAVLVYAQAGHGRRANLYTDLSFALWHEGALVTVAKAYSGLDDSELEQLDRWIKRHTLERYGPVRAVAPELVFEIGFEAVQASRRHRCGVAVRFPRILRWRTDKGAAEADTLATLKALAGLA